MEPELAQSKVFYLFVKIQDHHNVFVAHYFPTQNNQKSMNGPSSLYNITLPAAGADLKSYHVLPHPGLQQHHDQQQSHIDGGAPLRSIAELSSFRTHQYPNDDDAEASFHADAKGEKDGEAVTAMTPWALQDSEVVKPLVPASALNLCILTFSIFLIPSVYVVIYVTEIGAASLLAASLSGAVGVGVAYPFDTLKTKAQVYGQQRRQERQRMTEQRRLRLEQRIANNSVWDAEQLVETSAGSCVQTTVQSSSSSSSSTTPIKMEDDGLIDYEIFDGGCDGDEDGVEAGQEEEMGLLSLIGVILKNEGISGFYGGVKAMMIGQALIKSVAFSANELALGDNSLLLVAGFDDEGAEIEIETTPLVTLILAAGFAGFAASFVVAPVGELSFTRTSSIPIAVLALLLTRFLRIRYFFITSRRQ